MKRFLLSISACLLACQIFANAGSLRPDRLRCEYLEDPLGIDTPQPRLTWIVEPTKSRARNLQQTAFQVLVASSPKLLEPGKVDLWDSGKVESDQTAHIVYAGHPLASGQSCFWKVRVWDQAGNPSDFSESATWEMGLLKSTDWPAQWIGRTTDIEDRPAPMFRREFALDGKIRRARAYICGLGYYELRLNGEKVGTHLLDPGYTRYDRRALYVTYDVTAQLKKGPNAVGVTLGHGWFNVQTHAVWDFHKAPWRQAPKLALVLGVEYADGRTTNIVTDGTWKCSTGPIVFTSIYGGETYDARLEKNGWDKPDYDDSQWDAVKLVEAPKGKISAQQMPPILADKTLKPVRITEPKPGMFIVDFGQNFAGFAQLKARGPAGTKIVLKYGDRLAKDGTLDRQDIQQHIVRVNPSQQYQTDTYILKGKGTETWQSRFVYHGFQYVEVTGWQGKPDLDSLRGVFIHSAVPEAGEFECSNPMFNRIWQAARWAYLSNLESIPTDCPHREKNGWTGDAHLAAEQAIFNHEPATVYAKWINDLDDEQRPTGELPGIVPTSGWGYTWGNGPAWDSAFLLIPFYMHQYYGDTRILTDHYAGFRRYVDYLTSKAKDGIVSIGLNDWAPYKTQTPADITSTAYYYRDAQITALTASLLGKKDEAKRYTELAAKIKDAFNQKFYNAEKGIYGNGSQTALSCALYQGLVEPANQARVLAALIAAVERTSNHIDTGILGAKYLMNALLENGRADVAYRMANQKDLPSWGWWLEQGATTLWEQWNGTESRNHIMFGDISAWFFKTLGGINPDPAAPGFKHFVLRPQVLGELTSAEAEYRSIRGKIASDWEIKDGQFRWKVMIPANTTATVYLPTKAAGEIKENGRVALSTLKHTGIEQGWASFELGSGTYDFVLPMPKAGK